MFDSFKEPKVTRVPGPNGGPLGYVFKVTQGKLNHGEFKANEFQLASERAEAIRKADYQKNPRRAAALVALASTALVAAVTAGGFAALNKSEQPSDAEANAPTETKFITSTTTQYFTETPKPVVKVKVKRVEVTVPPKPHHHHQQQHHENVQTTTPHNNPVAPEAPASTYYPPQNTYTPPTTANAAKPAPHQDPPHFTVHHLHE